MRGLGLCVGRVGGTSALFALLTVILTGAGCSSDASPTGSADAASTGKGTGGGGGSGHDAASSTGGRPPMACATDAGSDGCRQCLAANCCSDFIACLDDSTCAAAFVAYQRCVKDATSTSAQGACVGGFSRSLKDAGASAPLGSAVGACVFRACTVCGASSI